MSHGVAHIVIPTIPRFSLMMPVPSVAPSMLSRQRMRSRGYVSPTATMPAPAPANSRRGVSIVFSGPEDNTLLSSSYVEN